MAAQTGIDYEALVQNKEFKALRQALSTLSPPDAAEVLERVPLQQRAVVFRLMPREQAAEVFEYLPVEQQTLLVQSLGDEHLVGLLNDMAPDDRTRLLEELPPEVTKRVLSNLSPEELKMARQLLGYPEDSAGRWMTPKYISLRLDMTASEALAHVRKYGSDRETLNVLYVLDQKGVLINDIGLEDLVLAAPETQVGTLFEDHSPVRILATAPREEMVNAFEKYDRVALPVTDSQGHMLGIVTVDDILDVAEEEATEDIQKIGGMEALEAPYMQSGLLEMIRKRAGWLAVLFVSEMFTSTALGYFEDSMKRVLVLALFVPLVISSGGNAGSQAASLIIRSLTLKELFTSEWRKVLWRELRSGLALGAILGAIGFVRILLGHWLHLKPHAGEHYILIGITLGCSLIGIVLTGTLVGAMLPLLLRRLGFDPATASTPFVATLVDVSGIIIFFEVAHFILRGVLL